MYLIERTTKMSIYKPDREQIVELEFSSKKHKKSKIKKFINRTYGPVEKSVYHKEGRAFLVCKNSEGKILYTNVCKQ